MDTATERRPFGREHRFVPRGLLAVGERLPFVGRALAETDGGTDSVSNRQAHVFGWQRMTDANTRLHRVSKLFNRVVTDVGTNGW